MPVHRRMGQDRKPQSLAGDVSAIHSAVDSGTRFGAMEGSCWIGPWELRVTFGWLVCLILPSSHRDVVTFYYTLWPTRTKGPIRLGSDTAHHTGCCRDGSPSPPFSLLCLLRTSKLYLYLPLIPESFSVCGRAVLLLTISQVTL